MTRRRALLVAVLVYLTLDLCLPAMPGAFVFEASESVESIGGGRPARPARLDVVTVPAADSLVLSSRLATAVAMPGPRREVIVLSRLPAHRLARAACAPSPTAEDSH